MVHLYNLTLLKPGAIQQCVAGSFSGPKAQEFAVARGDVLELLRPDESGKVEAIFRREHKGCQAEPPASADELLSPLASAQHERVRLHTRNLSLPRLRRKDGAPPASRSLSPQLTCGCRTTSSWPPTPAASSS